MKLLCWIIYSLFLSTTSIFADEIGYVFKGNKFSENVKLVALAKKIDFGLSAEQNNKIKVLTKNQVDFSDVYLIHKKDLEGLEATTIVGYSGELRPNIPPPVITGASEYSDPLLIDQWWIESLNVKKAWPIATGKGVVIADCDAGYYTQESDISSNLLLEHRYDLSDLDNPFTIDDGNYTSHGTSVVAIMSGVLDGQGTSGIAFDSKVIPLQNFNYAHNDKLDKEIATARCVLRAITTPYTKIIVLENQTATGSSETFVGTRDAVRLAIKAGIHVVSAAGNYSVELKEEEKDDTGSIIVGALFQSGKPAPWSNYGSRATIGAFGDDLFTLFGPNGRMDYFGGTSGATPQVAAAVAMMLEVNPSLSPKQVREIIQSTRIHNNTNAKVGGQIDIYEAVKLAQQIKADELVSTKASVFRDRLVAIFLNK